MPATVLSSTEVVLFQGGSIDLAELTPEQLDNLQWEQERGFARLIREAPRGSDERREAFRTGYDTVTRILAQRAGAADGHVRMGLSPRYTSTVLGLLADMRRRQQATRRLPRFFEIGFGCGELLEAVADAGYPVAGIEVSANMLEQARPRLPEEFRDRLYLGDLLTHELPGSERRYDLVYWNDVFEHLPVDESLDYLRRIHDLLASGGALVTVTPNWHIRPNDVTGDRLPPRSEPQGFHLKEYTLREMAALLREAGFARIETPLLVTRRRSIRLGGGLLGLKCLLEPALESLPFRWTHLLVRGLGLSMTIAWKA